ncbi:MAG TPA: hypothetical protein EYQ54_17575 [Myxococcales bacterium]|nr:hypothetical protein [Myxococcales bacterium]
MTRHTDAVITNANNKAATSTGQNSGKRFFWAIPLLALVLLTTGACSTKISVRRHPTVPLTNADATSILNNFGTLIRTADTATDFACASDFGTIKGIKIQPAFYVRDGAVGAYAGVSDINSEADFNAVIGTPGYAKVVNSINYCGKIKPNIVGCAPTPGNSFAIVRFTNDQEGILWAHEFGHTVGLPHRNGPTLLMNEYISPNRKEVNANECYAVVSKAENNPFTNPAGAASGAAAGGAWIGDPGDRLVDGDLPHELDPNIGLIQFVRRAYPHGTPMGFARRFEGSREIPELLDMLRNPSEQHSWGNIAAVLGMIGDSRVTPELLNFIQLRAGEIPRTGGPRLLTAAMMALGYLVNQTGDLDALKFLAEASSPSFWADVPQACGPESTNISGIVGAGQDGTGEYSCPDQLATVAAIGLALSGSGEGQEILRRAYRDALARQDEKLAETLIEYISVNDEIANIGLGGYYGN